MITTFKLLLGHTPEYISDLGCQYSRSIYTTRFIVWQLHHAADTSTNWRQRLFCCCTASMEQAVNGAKTAAIDGLVSSWSENISVSFCLRAPGYGSTLWCALSLLVGGAIQVPQLQLQLMTFKDPISSQGLSKPYNRKKIKDCRELVVMPDIIPKEKQINSTHFWRQCSSKQFRHLFPSVIQQLWTNQLPHRRQVTFSEHSRWQTANKVNAGGAHDVKRIQVKFLPNKSSRLSIMR